MTSCVVLYSNNPCFKDRHVPKWDIIHVDGSALEVLVKARDKIHAGWILTHHPLYGNFQAKHQPYRSLLLKSNPSNKECINDWPLDPTSLRLIEEALGFFQRCSDPLLPAKTPFALRRDCSLLDFSLMRTPLIQAGWPEETGL